MSDSTVAAGTTTVTLTLRRSTAERLRAICHARGETASLVVDRWVLSVDLRGDMPKPAQVNPFGDILGDLIGGRRK